MPSETVISLRKQLRDKFPSAHRETKPLISPSTPPQAVGPDHSSASPLPIFPSGAISEISPAHPSCGLSLIVAGILAAQDHKDSSELPSIDKLQSPPLVLIDSRDQFDPASFPAEECARLLWLRCHETQQALQAADLLLRDGNLPFILLDLSALPPRELRRIPNSSWHRLRQLAESTASTLLALTPSPLIPRAALRLTLTRPLTLSDLQLSRSQLLKQLKTQTTHQLKHSRTA